jgi:Na+/phosphate symporter
MGHDFPERDLTTTAEQLRRPMIAIKPTPLQRLQQFLSKVSWRKVGLFIVSIFLFILALTLMKEGARGLAPLLDGRFDVSQPLNSLGFGWLFAYLIMSGSPVAASALTFFDAGLLSELSAFTMITGSRFGSSFIVLFIGFIYVLRGRDRSASLSMGLLSFMVTGVLQVGTLIVGIILLQTNVLDGIQLPVGVALTAITTFFIDPIVSFLAQWLPGWALFPVGLGVVMVTFSLFDKCLPEMALKESQVGRVSRLVYRPVIMFTVGALVTLVSMSVSVSLSILVPLSHRGFVRRENVVPYIMGANITTFIDTLLAAVLLNNPTAFTIVLAQMVGVALISLLILITFYDRYERSLLQMVAWVTRDNRHLAIFMVTIFVVPLLLLLL